MFRPDFKFWSWIRFKRENRAKIQNTPKHQICWQGTTPNNQDRYEKKCNEKYFASISYPHGNHIQHFTSMQIRIYALTSHLKMNITQLLSLFTYNISIIPLLEKKKNFRRDNGCLRKSCQRHDSWIRKTAFQLEIRIRGKPDQSGSMRFRMQNSSLDTVLYRRLSVP